MTDAAGAPVLPATVAERGWHGETLLTTSVAVLHQGAHVAAAMDAAVFEGGDECEIGAQDRRETREATPIRGTRRRAASRTSTSIIGASTSSASMARSTEDIMVEAV
jgi:hypothetical protein